ncbi:4-amino-4-deoxychorismate lyase [Adhaeribacter aerolatus]|uniref:branched-chain-amino-acid transaminase n=1 Tax=Adhaeribacter aerolatus TaxID=670289 RepID=A0A512B4C4_9BACT|nr:aminotransferase class IV [Adhaeribacter aerolatus]GEO06801.1 4-amino-4-deoxychorismate lyase [Adhaeribacter aerolatus]
MFVSYNFRIIAEHDFGLSYANRGFQYNDGFFETLIWHQGKIRFLDDHLDRIKRAMQVLSLTQLPQLTASFLQTEANALIRQNTLDTESIRIKINIWRESGGLFTPESEEAEILITVAPQQPFPAVIGQADFYTGLPNRFTPFSFFKGPYALHYVQASLAKKKAGLDELILLDEQKNISECLVSNIFWIKNNQVFTPSLESGCIAGIMRLNVLRACQMLKIEVWEGFYTKSDLYAAEAVFTSNVTGLRPILYIGQKQFATNHPLVMQIEQLVLA